MQATRPVAASDYRPQTVLFCFNADHVVQTTRFGWLSKLFFLCAQWLLRPGTTRLTCPGAKKPLDSCSSGTNVHTQERLQGCFSTSPAAARPPHRKALADPALPAPGSKQGNKSKTKDISISRLHCRPPGRLEGSDQGLDRSPGEISSAATRLKARYLAGTSAAIEVTSPCCLPIALPALATTAPCGPMLKCRSNKWNTTFRLASRRQFRMESWLPSHKTHSWKNRGSSQVGQASPVSNEDFELAQSCAPASLLREESRPTPQSHDGRRP